MDPMLGTRRESTMIPVANEPLRPGPRGERLEVVDYDGGSRYTSRSTSTTRA
jgi:hypothetical protein